MTKQCKLCNAIKDIAEFNKNKRCRDGHINYCKDCNNVRRRLVYKTSGGKEKARIVSARDKEKIIAWKNNNKDKIKEYNRKYCKTEKGVAYRKKRYEQQASSGLKRVYRLVQSAVNAGQIVKNNICTVCSAAARTELHHHCGYDENNILNVIEVCKKCHIEEHKNAN